MPLGGVDDDRLQAEFPADAQGGGDIIRPVGVEVGAYLPRQQGEQRL